MTYQITLAGDGTVFSAGENETILQAALNQDVRLPYGCNNGLCFGCLQDIESGETAYREPVMDVGDLLKYQTMLCRAYATSDVVLGGAQLPDLFASDSTADTATVNTEHTTESALRQPLEPSDASVTIDARQPDKIPVKVIANELLCDDTRRVDLRLPDWVDLQYLAGQYLDVLLDNGDRRIFSIGNADMSDGVISLYIKQVEQGFFTGYVFDYLTLGTIWQIEAPLGRFVLRENDRPILMLGGSTGVAPLLAMLEHLGANQDRRRVNLYFGVRFAQRLFADKALTTLALNHDTVSYTPVVSRPKQNFDGSESGAVWCGRSGYVQDVAIADFPDLSVFDIYISGSPTMVDAATRACLAAGAQHEAIYVDVFSYQSAYTDVTAVHEVG